MVLSILFFLTAFLYACVGFGGGSTYSALLVLNQTDYRILPLIALCCNIIVVSGGVWHFSRTGHICIKAVLPWIVFSIPAAWVGGYLRVSEPMFIGLLGSTLLCSGLILLLQGQTSGLNKKINLKTQHAIFKPLIYGALLGFLAGITGIGGGIFLAPTLYLLGWNDPKRIAGTCSLFILLNSLAGILGHSLKLSSTSLLYSTAFMYWYLVPTVLIGGHLGSWLGSANINARMIKHLTAILIIAVGLRLLYKLAAPSQL